MLSFYISTWFSALLLVYYSICSLCRWRRSPPPYFAAVWYTRHSGLVYTGQLTLGLDRTDRLPGSEPGVNLPQSGDKSRGARQIDRMSITRLARFYRAGCKVSPMPYFGHCTLHVSILFVFLVH
ncbi:uncharacterized protein LY79DRAFT_571444 [Colletotrichum navitas]|uniref:Uncharacterized protein n=1 Tax=Colletotrichum navitas TaxID=681940 RepID=A0AAD8PLK8_9PEZI|nr:uncharacterized protein LY79DRAFT_571444 [Colletotrichum navitas]KAK1569662.1 hypothetical protein LY79DRAFT_571444 [Colletotrichum navitas]